MYSYSQDEVQLYSKAPLIVIRDPKLKIFSKLVYFEIYTIYLPYRKDEEYVFAKDEYLAKIFDVSTRYVNFALKDLEDNGYIERITSNFDKKALSRKRLIKFNLDKVKENFEINYCSFPKSIYTLNISNTSKLILIELFRLNSFKKNEEYKEIEESNGNLSEKLNVQRKTIIRCIKKLSELEYISITRRPNNKRYITLEKENIFGKETQITVKH